MLISTEKQQLPPLSPNQSASHVNPKISSKLPPCNLRIESFRTKIDSLRAARVGAADAQADHEWKPQKRESRLHDMSTQNNGHPRPTPDAARYKKISPSMLEMGQNAKKRRPEKPPLWIYIFKHQEIENSFPPSLPAKSSNANSHIADAKIWQRRPLRRAKPVCARQENGDLCFIYIYICAVAMYSTRLTVNGRRKPLFGRFVPHLPIQKSTRWMNGNT